MDIFKIGELDYSLLNYSLKVDSIYSANIPKNLVVTCLDQRDNYNFDYDLITTTFLNVYNSKSSESTKIFKTNNN